MLDVRTTSRVMELADTGKMAQLEKGRTFDSYADFIKEVESYEEKTCTKFVKGSYIEVYSSIEFPKHDFQFNYDTKCRVYVAILHHSGLSYKMF